MNFNSVVFCTTCKNRTQHLRLTLPYNLADNPNSKFVILNYNTEDDLLEYLRSEHAAEIATGHLVIYSNLIEPKFRMAHAKNMAHRLGIIEGGEILVNLDADNLTGARFEDFVLSTLTEDSFLWSNMIKGVLPRGINGRIAVTRRAFLKVGGYDEKFNEWGSDDKDFNLRLRSAGYQGVEIDPVYLNAIRHNDKIRFKEYPHLRSAPDTYYCVNKGTTKQALANCGDFGCGIVYRNNDFLNPIYLNKLPTKIFGIGMHKTATTSLHHALEILGYDSWHWPSAHAAKTIWREVNGTGRSPMLDRYHAACDLPIPRLYQHLDAAYPGSKFVLTIRDEQNWLDSVRRHFDPRLNPHRSGWDTDPFSNRIHAIMYGRRDFDSQTFLLRYRQHNQEVRDFFRHRPEDLLVMHMESDPDWAQLCGFLGVPIPEHVSYPKANGGRLA
jgi:Sulfotransferase domain/N-terminal domain of galactosyltransferase